MNPSNTPSFGSGSPLLGGTSPLSQVLAQGGPALNQVSPSAPTFNPSMQPPAPPTGSAMPQISPPSGPQGALPPEMGQPPLPQGSPDAQIILEALKNRLASDSKIKEAQLIPPKPTNISNQQPLPVNI